MVYAFALFRSSFLALHFALLRAGLLCADTGGIRFFLVRQRGSQGELDAALLVHQDHLDSNLVPYLDHVADLVNVAVGQFGDMA